MRSLSVSRARIARGNTIVLAYPSVQRVLTLSDNSPAPIRGFERIRSTFRQSMLAAGDFEAAYDIWLNAWNTEVMIWTDNHGQRPAGSPVASTVLAGQRWTLWASSGSSGGYPSGPFSFVLQHNERAGTALILLALDWLMSHRYIPSESAINDVEFGWEICSTNGRLESFQVKSYTLYLRR